MLKIAVAGRYRSSSSNGVDRTIEGHLLGMLERKYEVTLLTTENPSGSDREQLRDWGVKIEILSSNPIRYFLACLKMRNRFDLLSLHSVFTPLNWFVSVALGCARITTPNGGYSPKQIEYRGKSKKRIALWLYEKRMLEGAIFIQVLSENEREQLKLVAPGAQSLIVPNGFDSSLVPERKFEEPGRCLRLLFIGRVALMHKGLDILVEALGKLEAGVDWSLNIIGPAENGAIELLEGLKKNTPADVKIHFLGPIFGKEKEKYYEQSDIFVHTSRYEGMPFSVIEALSYGLPVLVTPGTNMVDLINRFDAGWTVDSDVPTVELVSVLTADRAEFPVKGKNAQKLVKEDLNWNVINKKIFSEVEARLK